MDPQLTEHRSHDEAEELLPWYATGQLDAADRMRVEAHLAACAECRRQLTVERQLMHEFRAMTPEIESGWNRLRARIERPGSVSRGRSGLAEFWQLLTRPAVAGLVAAQLAFVILAHFVEQAELSRAELAAAHGRRQHDRHVPAERDREGHACRA